MVLPLQYIQYTTQVRTELLVQIVEARKAAARRKLRGSRPAASVPAETHPSPDAEAARPARARRAGRGRSRAHTARTEREDN